MSKISADFGDINLTIATPNNDAYGIYRKLNTAFQASGVGEMEKLIEREGYDRFISKGPAKNLRADYMELTAF